MRGYHRVASIPREAPPEVVVDALHGAGVGVAGAGWAAVAAADVALCSPITDDRELQRSIREIVTTVI